MNLSHLSLQHCDRYEVPKAPTNIERYRAFLQALPVRLGNTHFSFPEARAFKQIANRNPSRRD